MSDYVRFKQLIEDIAKGVINHDTFAKVVFAKLKSVNPLKFELSDKIEIFGDCLISPKYRVFREDEIGNDFVFQEDHEGQRFIYLYEAAAPGQNGIEYQWKGRIDECRLIGTCPHGEVVVTHGTIEKAVHERGV